MMLLSRIRMLAALALATSLFSVQPVVAQTDADFSKYCRTYHPNSGPVLRATGGASAHFCNQGGSLQGIDLAKACELTTGSSDFSMLGDRVICAAGPGPADLAGEAPLTAADFVEYCRTKFTNSTYQDVPDGLGSQHHCRLTGSSGFTLQPIDLADACDVLGGSRDYREEAGNVFCVADSVTTTSDRRATGAGDGSGSDASADTPEPGDANADPEAPADGQASDGDEKGGGTKGAPAIATSGDLSGIWRMTAGVLPRMIIQFERASDQTIGTIVDLPPEAAATASETYGLAIGDVVVVGRDDTDKLTLRTRLGLVGSPEWVRANCPGDVAAYSERLANPWGPGITWYPVYELARSTNRIEGRHGGTEFIRTPDDVGGVCNHLYNDPWDRSATAKLSETFGGIARAPLTVDPSVRLPGFAVKFELERVCKPSPLATADKGGDDADPDDAEAEDKPEAGDEVPEPPSAVERAATAQAEDRPLELYFWTDGKRGWSAYTISDGPYAGPHAGEGLAPSVDPDGILRYEQFLRDAVEEGRWPGATLIYDPFIQGAVRGVSIPPRWLDVARPILFQWDRQSRILEEADPTGTLARPPLSEDLFNQPPSGLFVPSPSEEEPGDAEADDEPEELLDFLNEALVPC